MVRPSRAQYKLMRRMARTLLRVCVEEIMPRLGIFAIAIGALCIAAGATATHASAPAETRAASVEHGQYLVEHVAMCIECHSPRDVNGTIIAGQEFTGAPIPLDPPAGWAFRAPRNRGLLGYDDEQAMRLLTQGAIGRNGEQLRPPMPRFRMTHEDAADVIAFMRSLH
jgi:mono/diheme cytochrome c family protein